MRFADDSGFTLTELLVVLTLLGVLLAVIFGAVQVVQQGNGIVSAQSQFAQDLSSPLQTMDKLFSQNKRIVSGSQYSATIDMPYDQNLGISKRYVFAADSQGRLIETIQNVSGSGTTVTTLKSFPMSTHNSNIGQSLPLFQYLDGSGNTTTTAGARSVLIQISSTSDRRTMSTKRQVYFRNR